MVNCAAVVAEVCKVTPLVSESVHAVDAEQIQLT